MMRPSCASLPAAIISALRIIVGSAREKFWFCAPFARTLLAPLMGPLVSILGLWRQVSCPCSLGTPIEAPRALDKTA
jgi:hypothetical protein